ncbi:ABC transporter ATP-binding protein [Spirilliplanes yamanashiensis]|uniref:ABC transporter ATP-binding protein n=1 Tax=Spirilliplanes yamanashiensis TaxID=42233 RepID=A0A8J3Y3U7_9ACTN|nr:ABC transporter ATP-binding protein [Spirilliplanes yamanashiensis]MDP9819993.1 molybdate transport system ATP-binding protein [Spirilliplanes yamanashiensis]GIJ01188.1 ABC transporter ATP-binding protein [Spirilliplanes yamanashiensis]
MLDAHLVVDRGAFRLDVPLTVAAGEVVALLGPNGAGKTTALRALAGLTRLAAGHVRLDGRDLSGTPPERRGIGVVFQDYLLFPHLSALDNVAFGPRRQGRSRSAARALAADWLDRVGLAEVAGRRPRALSGGQAQRVALARALAVAPRLLLLDEPLAALDARTRLDTRASLHRHLGGFAGGALLVTHDPLDALVLANRLVIVEDGRVVQEGGAAEVTARPRTDYVARLVGLNLFRGTGSGATVRVGELDFAVADRVTGDAFVAFAPAAVAVHVERPTGSPRNTWAATVEGVQRHGDNLRVQLAGPVAAAADVTPAAAAQLGLTPGRAVWAAVKATETRSYPA